MPTHWEHFEHGADIGIRCEGPTKEQAFEQARLALTAVPTDPAGVKSQHEVRIVRAAPDDEILLLDWLNAVIYEMATRKILFARFDVRIAKWQTQSFVTSQRVLAATTP